MDTSSPLVSPETIQAAAAAIAGRVHRTPLLRHGGLSARSGFEVFLKAENLQKTGSFKVRGALNRVLRLRPEEAARGVVAASAGNHAQGIAYAAREAGVRARIVMPANSQPAKLDATRALGAELELAGSVVHEALERAREIERDEGMVFVHPSADPDVVAGAGTVGLEILEDLPDADAIVTPIGGGGLASGIATWARSRRPEIRVFGVQPVGAPCMHRSLAEGKLVRLETWKSIADGMAGPSVFAETFEVCRRWLDSVVLVSEPEILEAMEYLLTRAKLLTEGAGAGAVAAVASGRLPLAPGSKVVAVLSGGNQDLGLLAGWLRDARQPQPEAM